ncbi:FIG146085: 3'-to-5' oligoribonuclease A, Bacillus type [hydrothermal vent metagenome]|uniref:FIG146085: 3'-to-5' oligoribonuclease A, Bacillus type n=1 Tax=hydrothermal vent metagenome TaxID=652676 RepID=A0A1W1D2H3_9ZZZZ
MEHLLQNIEKANHIEIVTSKEFICGADALYTYILTRHKKVSFVCKEELGYRYSFLPWFDKIKQTDTPSADFRIDFCFFSLELFLFFDTIGVSINKKMAISLCAGLIDETDGFSNERVSGIVFASVEKLINYGAEYQKAYDFLMRYHSLAFLRLKSILLQNMILQKEATVAKFILLKTDLERSGATSEDAKEIIKEAFTLPYVKTIVLVDEDNNQIKKIEKGIEIEKKK